MVKKVSTRVILSLAALGFICACQGAGPRTPPPVSRLQGSLSPYLRGHADNPIDWHQWGASAFQEAERKHLPVFVSVGYSACHWCHVMEDESFMDLEVAEVLNRDFLCIKVDREERPDVDASLMNYVVASTGRGGWPMTVLLTPQGKPLWGGSYLTKAQLLKLLEQARRVWSQDSQAASRSADAAQTQLNLDRLEAAAEAPGLDCLQQAYAQLAQSYDATWGGWGRAPKFPQAQAIGFLLRYHLRHPGQDSLEMALETLLKMGRGGLYDPLEGGFHRYATDREWRTPHYEKMLVDQAELATVYLDAYALTGHPELVKIARGTLDFVSRSMITPDGGFATALDADSGPRHEEGDYYRWQANDLKALLGEPRSEQLLSYYALSRGNQGNLYLLRPLPERGPDRQALEATLGELRKERKGRGQPFRDDKVLTPWCAAMIAVYARASRQLDDPDYLSVAKSGCAYLEKSELSREDGGVAHHSLEGKPSGHCFGEDYSELIHAYLELHAATQEVDYLQRAITLQARQIESFWDDSRGLFRDTLGKDPWLPANQRNLHDSPSWSNNSRALHNLICLSALLQNPRYREMSQRMLANLDPLMRQNPAALMGAMSSLDLWLANPEVLHLRTDGPDRRPWRWAQQGFHPNRLVLWTDGPQKEEQLARVLPWTSSPKRPPLPSLSICRGRQCLAPVSGLEAIRRSL